MRDIVSQEVGSPMAPGVELAQCPIAITLIAVPKECVCLILCPWEHPVEMAQKPSVTKQTVVMEWASACRIM